MASILVVDDSATHRRVAGSLLEKRIGATGARAIEWKVSFACNGQEALDAIARDPPDLVLTDLLMPGIDGLQLLERIKQTHPSLPVILMTGYDSEPIAMEALARGAVCYVPKHKLPKELVDTADNILGMAEDPQRASAPSGEGGPQASARLPAALPRPPRPQPIDECWVQTESYYRVPNDPGCLATLLPRLQDNLRRLQLCDDNSILRVAVALREALSNAIVHGNLEISAHDREANPDGYRALIQQRQAQEPYSGRRVHLLIRETRDEVRYCIRDEGPGFDPTTAEAANPANLNQDTGRGLRMIKTFMDEVRHNDRGNEITLVKRRTSQ